MDGPTSHWPNDFEEKLSALLENFAIHKTGDWKTELKAKILALTTKNDDHPHFIVGEDSQESPVRSRSNSLKSTETQTVESEKKILISGPAEKQDDEILKRLLGGALKHRMLEEQFSNHRAVAIRRKFIEMQVGKPLAELPHLDYNYDLVNGACCENIIGYMPIPVGVAGPLRVNGKDIYIPLATTEGALVASTNRGCSAIMKAVEQQSPPSGVYSEVIKDGMTRAPVLSFKSVRDAIKIVKWIEDPSVENAIKTAFDKTSRFARLIEIDLSLKGTLLFLRFVAETGDAMGMNMVSKAANAAMLYIIEKVKEKFNITAELKSLSGNMCVDKKASAMNWIKGRGKSVISEMVIPADVVRTVLKTSVDELVTLAKEKLLVGSSMSGTIGGWNAHAANIVAAMFLATGQDAAQVVSSSMCYTEMLKAETGDLHITCTMMCLEVGTVGGGTILKPQQAALEMLGCCGAASVPGENAKQLAKIICAAVLAGELSLMASQCTNELVRSHLKLNRSCMNLEQNPLAKMEVHPTAESVADFRHLPITPPSDRQHLEISEKCNSNVVPGSRVAELRKDVEKLAKKIEKHKPSCTNFL